MILELMALGGAYAWMTSRSDKKKVQELAEQKEVDDGVQLISPDVDHLLGQYPEASHTSDIDFNEMEFEITQSLRDSFMDKTWRYKLRLVNGEIKFYLTDYFTEDFTCADVRFFVAESKILGMLPSYDDDLEGDERTEALKEKAEEFKLHIYEGEDLGESLTFFITNKYKEYLLNRNDLRDEVLEYRINMNANRIKFDGETNE